MQGRNGGKGSRRLRTGLFVGPIVSLALVATGVKAADIDAGASVTVSVADRPSHEDHGFRDLRGLERDLEMAESDAAKVKEGSGEAFTQAQYSLLGSLQAIAAAQAFIGQSQEAIETFDRKARIDNHDFGSETVGDARLDLAAIDAAGLKNAVEAIGRAAKTRQIVILNEAHHVAYDRAFAMQLARALRRIGFEYLACETFSIDDNNVLAKGYVGQHTGYYSREPMFVNFLASAMNDGWKFVSYEPNVDDRVREYWMAKNIADRVLATHPKARIFIYAGYSHARKMPRATADADDSRMAAQLRRITGIDPLTIDQTTLADHYDNDQQFRYYQHARRKLGGELPMALMGPQGRGTMLSYGRFGYDYTVVHPAYGLDPKTGRPLWMGLPGLGALLPATIPPDMLPTKGERLIYAYRKGSPSDAAPFDVVTVRAGQPPAKLMLPPGAFELEYEDDEPINR